MNRKKARPSSGAGGRPQVGRRFVAVAGPGLEAGSFDRGWIAPWTDSSPPPRRTASSSVSDLGPDSLRLHYRSKRPGLTPVAIGMVKGLGLRFGTPLTIEVERSREDGHDHDALLVRFGSPAAA